MCKYREVNNVINIQKYCEPKKDIADDKINTI